MQWMFLANASMSAGLSVLLSLRGDEDAMAFLAGALGWGCAAMREWTLKRERRMAADIVRLPDGTIFTNGTIQNGKLVRG